MDAELRTAIVAIDEGTDPDWGAGHRWIDTVPAAFLRECHEGRHGAADEQIAADAHRLVDDLKGLLADPPRTVDWCHVRGARVYLTGWLMVTGTEDPPEPYLLLSALASYSDWDLETGRYREHGSLLGALGFDD